LKYELGFLEEALKEWGKLDNNTREQFKVKLTERLANPRVPGSKLSGHKHRYKIKLRSVGYRLVYEVRDSEVIVIVVAVGNASEMRLTRLPRSARSTDSNETDLYYPRIGYF